MKRTTHRTEEGLFVSFGGGTVGKTTRCRHRRGVEVNTWEGVVTERCVSCRKLIREYRKEG
jgi:hypothetical protein